MKPILFLDVDGVLNRCGHSAQGLESDKLDLLQWIVTRSRCDVVVSSTWRTLPDCKRRLLRALAERDIEPIGCTPDLNCSRGTEISVWLKLNRAGENFVILDDDEDMGELLPHLVRTLSYGGLTSAIAAEVVNRFEAMNPEP